MRSKIKVFAVLLALTLLASSVITGCGASKSPTNGGTSSTPTPEPRITLRMFMSDSGLTIPQDVDPSNNPFINIVKDYANVDLQLEVPPYASFGTKLNLMLASGDLPDIIHSIDKIAMIPPSQQGAFISLKKYYDNSVNVKKVITPQMMDIAKVGFDDYYRIPFAFDQTIQGGGNYLVRYDLLEKYNGGKWPTTIDEWVAFLEWVKQQYPNSTPISCTTYFEYGQTFWRWYGVDPNGLTRRVQDGKVVSDFVLPEFREALQLWQKLYKDGVLDPDFATTNSDQLAAKITNNQVTLQTGVANGIMTNAQQSKTIAGRENFKYAACPNLSQYPKVLKDVKYTYWTAELPISSGHGVFISSSCKNPDRAWKVIEGLASPELKDAVFWGKEGSEYTVQNGQRIPNLTKLNDASRSWAKQLAMIWGFYAAPDLDKAVQVQSMGQSAYDFTRNSLKVMEDNAKTYGVNFDTKLRNGDTTVDPHRMDAANFVRAIVTNVIIGKKTIEDYDQAVKDFKTQFGYIDDAYTKQFQSRKDELTIDGCKQVNW